MEVALWEAMVVVGEVMVDRMEVVVDMVDRVTMWVGVKEDLVEEVMMEEKVFEVCLEVKEIGRGEGSAQVPGDLSG